MISHAERTEMEAIEELLRSNAIASWDTAGFATLGIEDEFLITQKDGRYAAIADDVVLGFACNWVASEFGGFSLEVKTDKVDCTTHGFIPKLWNRWVTRVGAVCGDIRRRGCCDVRYAFMTMEDEEMEEDWVSRVSPRFVQLLQVLGKRSGRYTAEIPCNGSCVRFDVPAAPKLAGRTAQVSANASYNNPALAFDLHLALGWVNAVFSNSASRGVYGLRTDAWILGMDKEGVLTGFDPGGYLCQPGRSQAESLLQWFRFVADGQEVLPASTFGKPTGAFPLLDRKVSFRWMKSARLRWVLVDDKLEFRKEDGFADVQPTMLDSLALVLLIEGVITKLLVKDGITSADELMSVDEARRAHTAIRRNGPKKQCVRWRGADRDPCEVVLDELIPAAIEGLALKGVERTFSDPLFSLLRAQIAGSELKTGSAWFLRRAAQSNERSALSEMAAAQRQQQLSLDGELQGIAHW